jgi:hypothetical protein
MLLKVCVCHTCILEKPVSINIFSKNVIHLISKFCCEYKWCDKLKAFNNRIFKTDFKFEEYFDILDEQNYLLLCKFRTTNHKLSIEKGRWSNIPRENRYCELCQKNQIGDEYHCIFECTNLSEKRTSLLPNHLIERPNIIKFKNLMTNPAKTM